MSPSPAVLSRLYLSAVLPCLADLADQDQGVREILGEVEASIVLGIVGGPAATVRMRSGRVDWQEGAYSRPSVVLLFLGHRHLNAFFRGKKWAVPLPVWGAWKIGVLATFSKVAAVLECVLNGDPTTLGTTAGRRMHARLSLIAAGLGLRPLARGDAAARQALGGVPRGLACFTIDGENNATVWFDNDSILYVAGWGPPPRRPDVLIVFADVHVAYCAMRDEIDAIAAVGAGHITVDGLVPLADGLNVVMERLRTYLPPRTP